MSTFSGPRNPGAGATDTGVGDGVSWTGANNILASDDTYAEWAINGNNFESFGLTAKNFTFAIPSGVTIKGIVVEIERRSDTNSGNNFVIDGRVRIIKADGSYGTTNKADASTHWPLSDTYATYGSSSDLWGETWTFSDINDADFGVLLTTRTGPSAATTITVDVDHVRITVYYSESFTTTMAQGSYTLTGQTIVSSRGYTTIMAQGAYTLTGFALAFIGSLWTRLSKSTSIFSTDTKHSSSWNNDTKHSSTFTNDTKSS